MTQRCHESLIVVVPSPLFRKLPSIGKIVILVCRPGMPHCATPRIGRKIWKKWPGYHQRSLVEDQDALLPAGERVMVRDFDRQVDELQVRAATLCAR